MPLRGAFPLPALPPELRLGVPPSRNRGSAPDPGICPQPPALEMWGYGVPPRPRRSRRLRAAGVCPKADQRQLPAASGRRGAHPPKYGDFTPS